MFSFPKQDEYFADNGKVYLNDSVPVASLYSVILSLTSCVATGKISLYQLTRRPVRNGMLRILNILKQMKMKFITWSRVLEWNNAMQ